MTIAERLDRIERLLIMSTKEVLNTKEVALLLDMTEDRVRHLVCERALPHYKNGSKCYYKRSEIEAWQLKRRVPTAEEIDSKATTYMAIRRLN